MDSQPSGPVTGLEILNPVLTEISTLTKFKLVYSPTSTHNKAKIKIEDGVIL